MLNFRVCVGTARWPTINGWRKHKRVVRLRGCISRGMVYAEIELINGFDLRQAEAGADKIIGQEPDQELLNNSSYDTP